MEYKPDDADFEQTLYPSSRWLVLRDVISFQFKLALDGVRDVLLSPISIFAAIAGVIAGGDQPGRYFYSLLSVGRRTEIWINLFGGVGEPGSDETRVADDYIVKIQELLIEEYEKGGRVKDIKEQLDRLLDSVRKS